MPQTLHNWIALKEKTARCCRLAKQNGEVQVIVSCSRPATNSWFAGCRIATCELGMLHDLFKRLRFLSGCVFRTLIRATESFSYRLWNKGILKELNLLVFFFGGGDEVKGPLQIWTFFYGSINDLIQMIFLKHCSHSSSIGFAGCYCTITMLFMKPFGFAFCFQTTKKIWLQENCICFIVVVSSLSWCGMTLGKVFLSWKTELYKKLLS